MRLLTVVVLVILVFACSNRKSTNLIYIPSLAELDSMYIKLMIDSLDKDYFGNMNEGLPREEWTNFGGWYNGEVKYSADSLLRIYSFTGEGCGAYCSPLYTSIIRFDTFEVEEWFIPVDTIYQLNYNNYLVLTKGVGRPRGIESSLQEVAYIFQADSQFNYKTIAKASLSSFIVDLRWSEYFLPAFFDEYKNLINYNGSTKTLETIDYQYDDATFFDSFSATKKTSTYTFRDSIFEILKTSTYIETGKK
jgi:hypothetical protein